MPFSGEGRNLETQKSDGDRKVHNIVEWWIGGRVRRKGRKGWQKEVPDFRQENEGIMYHR